MDSINALTPLDGRYCKTIAPLRPFFSESAYIRYRIIVEVAWLKAMSLHLPQLPPFSPSAADFLDSISSNFTDEHAARCKELESVTNHDVKAIEYSTVLKLKLGISCHSRLQVLYEGAV
jgi:adenylosuccinate lyase